jgi:Tfp pilus assembly protein PilF
MRRDRDAVELYQTLLARSGATSQPLPGGAAAVHGNLALAQYRLGLDEASRREALRSLELDPWHGEAAKTMGLLERRAGRRDSATRWLRKAVALNPAIPEAQLALAELATEAGDVDMARERYQALLEAYQRHRGRDFHHRWRNLFAPLETDTETELRRRIERLAQR